MLRRLSAPQVLAVTLEEAKAHLRVDHDAEDDVITSLLQAAIEACADEAGRAFSPAPYQFSVGCWPRCGFLDLPMAPVSSVDLVEYVGEDGETAELSADAWTWTATSEGARVRFDPDYDFPDLGSDFTSDGRQVSVTFTAGYADPAEITPDLDGSLILPSQGRSAVLLTLGHLYANREAVVVGKSAIALPMGAKYLISQIRIYR